MTRAIRVLHVERWSWDPSMASPRDWLHDRPSWLPSLYNQAWCCGTHCDYPRSRHLLSVRSCLLLPLTVHLWRTWISWLFEICLYKYSRILSDSSLDNSLIRLVNLMSTPSCPRNIRTIDKKSLPSRDRIGPNDRMNSSQIVSDGFAVLWRTAILGKRESQSLTRLKEVCSLMSGGQSLQPAPERGGQTIVRFIRRCP